MTNEEIAKNIYTIIAGDEEMTTMYNYFSSLQLSEKEILEKLSLLNQLKSCMQENVIQFVFKKLNGEIRTAFGTRAQDVLVQNGDVPQNRRKSSTTFPYYDIEKKAWRCFKPELLQSINLNYSL